MPVIALFVACLSSLTIFHTVAYSALFIELTHQHTAMPGVIAALRKQVIEIKMVDRTRARYQHRALHRPCCPGSVGRSLSGRHNAPLTLSLVVAPHTQPYRLSRLQALRVGASHSARTSGIRSPLSSRVHPQITPCLPGPKRGRAVLDS